VTSVNKILLALVLMFLPSIAHAQFQASSAKTFIDWPNLQVDPLPGQQSEAMVYAVIEDDVALYTIAVQNRTSIAVLGAFQCNREFGVLKSSSNGFYDIRCVNADMFEEATTYILKFGKNQIYNQNF